MTVREFMIKASIDCNLCPMQEFCTDEMCIKFHDAIIFKVETKVTSHHNREKEQGTMEVKGL